jgi:transglycosylase-like protein
MPLIAFLLGALGAAAVAHGPALALWLLRRRIERVLGAPFRVGEVIGRPGRVILTDVRAGVLRAHRVTLHYRAARLLLGRLALDPVEIEGASVELAPSDLRRLRARLHDRTSTERIWLELGVIRVIESTLRYRDPGPGLVVEASLEAVREPREPLRLTLRRIKLALAAGPTGSAERIDASLDDTGPRAHLRGGRVAIWHGLVLSDIEGTIAPEEGGKLTLSFGGGWGDAGARLWTAQGSVDPAGASNVRLFAQRFHLDRLGPVIAHAPLRDADRTEVDADLELTQSDGALDFSGRLEVFGLTVYHPGLAPAAVPDLGATLQARGRFDARARRLRLDEVVAERAGVTVRLDGQWERLGTDHPLIQARLQVAPVGCRRLLEALPAELLPVVRGFQLDGTFAADLRARIDFSELDKVDLDGRVGIDGCRVLKAPDEADAQRLLVPFQHTVHPMPGEELVFEVGPGNPDFTPLHEISPHVISAITTTEDSQFFDHHGFLLREFRTALARDLRERRFALGASSITMQMVKNVMLSPEKTLARKVQELFLTWYVEQNLPKERILEIYLNVIEFGPGIYGIGRAARHYFGKAPHDLSPREAAFFSSILPSPKRRYVHYCHGAPTPRWERYLDRILRRMHERGRLSDIDYHLALIGPLVFDRAEAKPEAECLKFVEQIVQANEVPLLPEDEPDHPDPDVP